ncbi:MAG: thioredoxin [Alistipes sp.]|nr:thioredoxin [Alistipes sp.]
MKKILIAMTLMAAMTACTTNAQTKTEKKDKTMKTIELNKQQFIEKVFDFESNPTTWKYEGSKPAIVDFYATWCRPCQMVAPILEELAEEYGDSIVIYKVDTDREREISAAFGIRSIPSLLFIPAEGKPQMVQGAMGKADFRNAIDKILLGK